jgi:hypothetical protein
VVERTAQHRTVDLYARRVSKCRRAAVGVERPKVLEQARFSAPFHLSYGLQKVDINGYDRAAVAKVDFRP